MALCAQAAGASRTTETQSLTKEEAQVEVNFQRRGEQWGNGNGQRFVMGHVSGHLEKLSLVAVSGGKRGLSNVWVMSRKRCRALGCSLCSSAAVWEDGPVSPCPVPVGCTAEPLQQCPPDWAGDTCVTGSCPCWKPPGRGVCVAGVPVLPSEAHALQFPEVLESVCGDADSVSWCWP